MYGVYLVECTDKTYITSAPVIYWQKNSLRSKCKFLEHITNYESTPKSLLTIILLKLKFFAVFEIFNFT